MKINSNRISLCLVLLFFVISLVVSMDFDDVKKEIKALLTKSDPKWPADYGHYGPLFVRLAWHSAGSYRIHDGRGGSDGGRMRFDPERSWPDNTNLDKARSLLKTVKGKFGDKLSWADLFILAGNSAIEDMGGPKLDFCGGRVDDMDGSDSNLLGPSTEQEILYPCKEGDKPTDNGKCAKPLGATTVGLIYVNPEGPMGTPNPERSADQIRDTFTRMNMNDRETVALIGGGHAIGKTHGACKTGPGKAPRDNPNNPWAGTCGTGDMKGKGENTFTSGFEFPWTTNPKIWTNTYFTNLLKFVWKLRQNNVTKGGHFEWEVDEVKSGKNSPLAPKAHGDGEDKIGMLTSDIALIKDLAYKKHVEGFANNKSDFDNAFKDAWYKLTSRDMGPHSRCKGDLVPKEAKEWQYPLLRAEKDLANFKDVKEEIKLLLTTKYKGMFIRLAWRCMSTFRSTDYLGGCNGARIRLEPQKSWAINKGTSAISSKLNEIKARYGKSLSWADLIILAGNTEIEDMGGRSLPFCGGRSDATKDGGASDMLDGKITEKIEKNVWNLKEFYHLTGLTYRENAALHGAGYAIGQKTGCTVGLFCRRDDKPEPELSNIFFKRIVENEWEKAKDGEHYVAKRNPNLKMKPSDAQFYLDPELKKIAEEYAMYNSVFLDNFAFAWTKLANADRFKNGEKECNVTPERTETECKELESKMSKAQKKNVSEATQMPLKTTSDGKQITSFNLIMVLTVFLLVNLY